MIILETRTHNIPVCDFCKGPLTAMYYVVAQGPSALINYCMCTQCKKDFANPVVRG